MAEIKKFRRTRNMNSRQRRKMLLTHLGAPIAEGEQHESLYATEANPAPKEFSVANHDTEFANA